MRPFEIAIIGFFAVAAIGGLVYLSMYNGAATQDEKVYGSRVLIWGTYDKAKIDPILSEITRTDEAFSVVKYEKVDERTLEGDLLNAIADGTSPDLVILPHTLLALYRSKLVQIPYTTIDERTLRDTYIDGTDIFRDSNGSYAIPFAVDPLVLFWNRDLFSNAGIATPPKTWETLVLETTPALTRTDDRRALITSAIALGEYINVLHAKEILSMFMLQAGASIVRYDTDRYVVDLSHAAERGIPPGRAALNFYVQFASPGSRTYTWNRTQQMDRSAFAAGTLGMYIGEGSEITALEEENPNLNFDVTTVPQSQGVTALRNFGTFYGLVIPKASQNQTGAFRAAQKLTDVVTVRTLLGISGLAPVHRSLFAVDATRVYDGVLNQSALIARGWHDPSPRESSTIFKTMIETLQQGRGEIDQIVNDAAYSLEVLFR